MFWRVDIKFTELNIKAAFATDKRNTYALAAASFAELLKKSLSAIGYVLAELSKDILLSDDLLFTST